MLSFFVENFYSLSYSKVALEILNKWQILQGWRPDAIKDTYLDKSAFEFDVDRMDAFRVDTLDDTRLGPILLIVISSFILLFTVFLGLVFAKLRWGQGESKIILFDVYYIDLYSLSYVGLTELYVVKFELSL